jgi:hypothetical protein
MWMQGLTVWLPKAANFCGFFCRVWISVSRFVWLPRRQGRDISLIRSGEDASLRLRRHTHSSNIRSTELNKEGPVHQVVHLIPSRLRTLMTDWVRWENKKSQPAGIRRMRRWLRIALLVHLNFRMAMIDERPIPVAQHFFPAVRSDVWALRGLFRVSFVVL